MKRIIYTFLLGLVYLSTAIGQPYDLTLSLPETGTQLHQATNSITLAAGYSYTPAGGTMLSEIVNKYVTGSVSYNQTIVDPANRTINTSPPYLVGAINGAFDVNSAGGASYSIPIDLLPGANGLTPSLSLVYSSNSGSGVAGYGWQIGGISSIGRTGRTIYNDGAATGVDLTSNDKFSLDGKRMVLTSGTYGADQATYQTEIDEFSRIQSQSVSGSGPGMFMVQTKAGLKNLYGSNDDGRQRINSYSEVLTWFLTQTSDLYGNLISYSYMRNNYMVYPAEINYGPNKISFYYKERTDVTTSYMKGQKIEQRMLLDKITVAYNNNIVKTYELKYNLISNNYNNYSVLNEVIEYGTDGSRLNSTVFSYQTPANVAIAQSIYNTSNNDISYKSKLYAGDFNNDGKSDFLCLPDASKGATWTGWRMYLGDGNNNFSLSSSGSENFNYNCHGISDLNGDGKDDLIMSWYWSDGYVTTERFEYWISTGVSFTKSNYFAEKEVSYGYYSGSYSFGYYNEVSDYNGDGLADFFLYTESGYWEIYSYAYNNGTLSDFSLRFSGRVSSWNGNVYSNDFNGDGKSDIWNIDSNGTKIYSLIGSSLTQIYSSTFPNKDHQFRFGDFNSDGKSDLFIFGNGSTDWTTWQIQLSNGTGFENFSIAQKKSNIKDDIIRQGDFNGDGRTDLMVSPASDNSWTGRCYYMSNNNGTDFVSINSAVVYPYPIYNYYMTDIDGDGRTDYLCTAGGYTWTGYQIYKSTVGNTAPLLEKVTNGLNNLTTIAYTKLSQASTTVYQKGATSPVFPVVNFQEAMPVVSSVTMDNGIGGTKSLSYYYEGAKIHLQGKGFLGFSKMSVTDASTGIISETQSDYNTTYFSPLSGTVTKKTTGGSIIETTTNTFTQKVLDASTKRIFPYIQSSTQTNALTGHSVTGTTSSVDSYGNPTQVIKDYGNGVTETTVSNYTNTVSSTDWNLGRVDNSTITYAKSGETSVGHTVRYTYYTDGIMKPDYIYYNEGTSLEYYQNHDYDSKGNLTQVYTNGSSIGASQTNYTYDTDGIRVLTTTDALGHVSTNTYDNYGRLLTEKDYLNNTNTYGYDAMGRKTSVSNTNGSQSATTFVWTGTNKPALAVYGMTQTGNDGSVSTAWYDKLGRTIRTEKKGFGGTMILTNTEYNAKGQVYRVSDPYFAGTGVAWAETYTNYDAYGRITAIDRNTGRNTVIGYTTNRVTETTNGKITWKETNSQGLVSAAHDNGGDITYTYYPDGKTKTITAGGVVTNMLYADAARNQTQLGDPSAGTINYTYDSFGRVLTQKDARNKLTTYTYYPDGRINTRVTPEGTSTYSYNTNKQLTGISSPGGVSRTYGYDTQGRVTSISETIAGRATPFLTTYAFDTYGRLSTITHPSGIVETRGYNEYGYMKTISAGWSVRYTVTGMNAREQLTAATYGSNLVATYGFDTYGYPSSTTTGAVQDYRYVFDPATGNLTSRQNYLRGKSESFTYDNLDRLLTVTGPQNLTMTYADNGNLATKSDIGTSTFSYGLNAGPYALTGVTSSTNIIPAVTQTVNYYSFEKVANISEVNGSQTIYTSFAYNSDNQRARMTVGVYYGAEIMTRYYVGDSYMLEVQPNTSNEYTYLGGDAYTAPVVVKNERGAISYYYLLRDYLGNITHQVNTSNAVVAEYSFDAWGRRRNATNWSYTLDANDKALFADRGFTGHEYLPWYNLYNMNGRMYDPAVGRFLNVDPYVQMPDNTQSFNRYSYCINNPLKYSDQNGEWFGVDDLVEFIVGGTVNVIFNWGDIDNFWEGLSYFSSGGVGSWITFQSFGLATPIGGAITSAGNSMLATNFLTKENGYSLKSISGSEWKDIMEKTAIGTFTAWAGDWVGGKLANKAQDKLHIKSEFWNKSSEQMIKNGISNGLDNYMNSTLIDGNAWDSKEAFQDLAMGVGIGVANGMASTLLDEKWARPEIEKLKDLKIVLNIKKQSWLESTLKNFYIPNFTPNYTLPRPARVNLPNYKNN